MRIILFLAPAALALGILSACGGCGHGSHTHPTGNSWERPPEFEVSCTCTESGIECEDGATTRNTSGGMLVN